MRSQVRSDGVRSPISPPSRSPSLSSIGSPSAGRFALSQPPHNEFSPAYVASDAAAELVSQLRATPTNEQREGLSVPDESKSAVLNDEALAMINAFLDFLVFNILGLARSSALEPIRNAVEHIVKGRLGQQAIKIGDYELEELLNEDDDAGIHGGKDAEGEWDVDLVWKRTRLKIMTYMRLSEMEEEDDEDTSEDGSALDEGTTRTPFSQRASLYATIFLTSALERIAEQCVKDAGEGAYNRLAVSRPGTRDGSDDGSSDTLIVTEQDVRKLALSSLVGRLWRQWKHTIPRNSPRAGSLQGGASHERTYSGASDVGMGTRSRRPSALGPIRDTVDEPQQKASEPTLQVQSPKSPRPISDQTANRRLTRHAPRRSRSFGRFPVAVPGRGARPERGSWQAQSPRTESRNESRMSLMRSNSLPAPAVRTSYISTTSRSEDEPSSTTTTELPIKENRKSRNSRDMAIHPANAAARVADADVAAVSGKRLSREARRSMRNSREVRGSLIEPTESMTEEQGESISNQQAPSTAQMSPSADDDEYDPFRADSSFPAPVKSQKKPSPAASTTSQAPPVHETLRKLSQRDSADVSPQRTPDATATLAGGAVSSAILGQTSQRKTKKPAPLDMTGTSANNRTERGAHSVKSDRPGSEIREEGLADATAPSRIKSQEARDMPSKGTSPGQTSAGRADEFRTPSSSKLQRVGTSDTSSVTYETPRGSPTVFGTVGEQEDRPQVQQHSSDPILSVTTAKPTSPKQKRSHARTAESPVERAGAMSPRSEREFNEMMSGNQTVKRSLTPKTLTDIEAVDSPRLRQQQVKPAPPSPMTTQYPTEGSREVTPRPSDAQTQKPKKVSNIGALRQAAEAKAAEKSPPTSSSRPTRNGHTVRDAREQTYRTNDMADFFRSTGPKSPDQGPRPFASTVGSGKAPVGSPSQTASSAYQPPSVKAIVPNTSRMASKKKMPSTRPERQANDDLISFLNAGPPGAHVSKTKSMETTHSHLTEGGLGAISPNNRSSSQMSQSINESVNSHSGLLAKHERSQMNTSASRTAPVPKMMEGGPPARKQRRNKDPYAIDMDDEDGDILTGLPPKDEPSDSMGLVDFLRNTAPPDDNMPSGPGNRMASPPPGGRTGNQTAGSGGSRPLHKPIPSNEEIKRDPRSDQALPTFLKEERTVRPRQSYDSNHSGRKASRGGEGSRGGMRGLFKRIGVNG